MSDGLGSGASSGGAAPPSAPSTGASSPSTSTDGGATPDAGGANGATQAPSEPWRTVKHKVNLDGSEAEVPYDELVKGYQRARVSQARYEEAARLRKQAEGVFRNLQESAKRGDRGALRQLMTKLGYDPRSFSEAELNEAFRQEQMTPEQRRAQEFDLRERQLAHREAKLAKDAHEREIGILERQYAHEAEVRAPAALKAAGVPQTPKHLKHLATLMVESIGTDAQLSYEEAAAIVAEEYRDDVGAHLGALDLDDVMKLIGDERMKEVRKRDLERIRNGGAPPSPSEAAPAQLGQARPQKAPLISTEAYFKKLMRGM